jgi:polyisoprenoid-binding protein YceI
MVIDRGKVSDVDVNVDLTTLESDKDRRDQALHHRGLESDSYPTATFALTEPIALTRTSESVATTAQGELTVHGVTKAVDVDVQARMSGGRIAVVGHAPLQLSEFGIQAPTGYSVLSIEDQGSFEFQIFFVPGPGGTAPSEGGG